MNRRTFLTGTPVAVTLATTLAAKTAPRDRKKVLIPQWEPERVEDLKAAVPEVELVVAKNSLEQGTWGQTSFQVISLELT